MSKIWISSDLHLGHRAIGKYRAGVSGPQENDELILGFWKAHINDKRDHVWLLGDVAFTEKSLLDINQMPGKKFLVRGNHDTLVDNEKLWHLTFREIHGHLKKWKALWLSHPPMHPQELYGLTNVHGHVHEKTVPDTRYFNACVDNLMLMFGKPMITLQQLREHLAKGNEIRIMPHRNYSHTAGGDSTQATTDGPPAVETTTTQTISDAAQ